jgi:SAM-dependent methyltransferase
VCRRNGFDAVGCDLGGDSVRVAAKYFSVELAEGSIDSLGLEEQSLDVVAGFNLLSHIYRPWVYVREVERVLNPGGVWLVRTGDRTGWRKRVGWGSWSAPEHIYHYTRRFLEEIIQDTGMKIDWIRPAFDSDYPYLIWRIVEKFPKIFKPSAKRVAGYFHYFWTICRFPREDIYILARKPQ